MPPTDLFPAGQCWDRERLMHAHRQAFWKVSQRVMSQVRVLGPRFQVGWHGKDRVLHRSNGSAAEVKRGI